MEVQPETSQDPKNQDARPSENPPPPTAEDPETGGGGGGYGGGSIKIGGLPLGTFLFLTAIGTVCGASLFLFGVIVLVAVDRPIQTLSRALLATGNPQHIAAFDENIAEIPGWKHHTRFPVGEITACWISFAFIALSCTFVSLLIRISEKGCQRIGAKLALVAGAFFFLATIFALTGAVNMTMYWTKTKAKLAEVPVPPQTPTNQRPQNGGAGGGNNGQQTGRQIPTLSGLGLEFGLAASVDLIPYAHMIWERYVGVVFGLASTALMVVGGLMGMKEF